MNSGHIHALCTMLLAKLSSCNAMDAVKAYACEKAHMPVVTARPFCCGSRAADRPPHRGPHGCDAAAPLTHTSLTQPIM